MNRKLQTSNKNQTVNDIFNKQTDKLTQLLTINQLNLPNSKILLTPNLKQKPMQQSTPKTKDDGKPPTAIFTLMTLTNILINLDHGILPACTQELKAYYDMNQTELGFLGSVVYLGIVLMGLFAGRLYQKINSKLLTLGALIALEFSLALFILSKNKGVAYFCRFLTGICQVFLLVYYPIWIDKFGFKKKTLWLTLLQICVPVGIFAGYGMTSVVIGFGLEFKFSFYLQIGMVACFIVAFGLLSKTKLDSRRQLGEQFNQFFLNQNTNHQNDMIQPNNQPSTQSSSITQQKQKPRHHTMKQMLLKLLKSKMYFVGTMTMAIILFVSTGVQFWLTDYFIYVLKFQRERVNIAYAVVSITGPTTGCGFGGFILSKRGGYDSPKAVYWVFLFSCIGIGSAISIPFLTDFYWSASALWIVLFFGGAMMPGLTGIMMASVPPYLRAFGNSTGEIIKNCFGYLPAPFIYGWFNQLFDTDKAGIKVLMFWGLWAPVLLGFGSLYRFRQLKHLDMKRVRKNSYERKMSGLMDKEDEVLVDFSGELKVEEEAALISEYLAAKDQGEVVAGDSKEELEVPGFETRQSSGSQIEIEPDFELPIQKVTATTKSQPNLPQILKKQVDLVSEELKPQTKPQPKPKPQAQQEIIIDNNGSSLIESEAIQDTEVKKDTEETKDQENI